MASIVAFLHARINEDEAAARSRSAPAGWSQERVLLECRSKRTLLDIVERENKEAAEDDDWEWFTGPEDSMFSWLLGESAEDRARTLGAGILSAMALPYSQHPEWQRGWRIR